MTRICTQKTAPRFGVDSDCTEQASHYVDEMPAWYVLRSKHALMWNDMHPFGPLAIVIRKSATSRKRSR